MPRFANSNRPAPARLAALPALLLLAASLGACGDDLNSPDVQSCDLSLPVPVTEPATVEYGVDAENATVASVTFTTPVGDSTITSRVVGRTRSPRRAVSSSGTHSTSTPASGRIFRSSSSVPP